jgi:hypothetical protein
MPVPALAGEILFFACPKKSIQKKRPPNAACFLRSSVLTGVAGRDFLSLRQRAASLPHPSGRFPPKLPVLGTAYGKLHSFKQCSPYGATRNTGTQTLDSTTCHPDYLARLWWRKENIRKKLDLYDYTGVLSNAMGFVRLLHNTVKNQAYRKSFFANEKSNSLYFLRHSKRNTQMRAFLILSLLLLSTQQASAAHYNFSQSFPDGNGFVEGSFDLSATTGIVNESQIKNFSLSISNYFFPWGD